MKIRIDHFVIIFIRQQLQRTARNVRPRSVYQDFDWADETMHAGYGKRWLKELLAIRGQDPASYDGIRERCEKLVTDFVKTATAKEVADIKRTANALIAKASQIVR